VYFLILGAVLCTVGVLCAIFASAVVLVIPAIFMGLGEALIMLFWLHLYSETSANNTVRYLAASMIIGSISCFLTRNLTYDISLFVTICLPLLSSFMLGWTWSHVRIRHKAQGERGIPDYKSTRRPFVTTTLQLVIYAFVFGLLQGSVTPAGEALLYVFNPASILGAAVAGLGVLLLVSHDRLQASVAIARQISLLLLAGGLLLLPFLAGETTTFAATVILCAYILFDQIALVQTVNLTRLFDLNSWLMLGINRAMVYLAFALGLLIGFPLMNAYAGNPLFCFYLTSAAVFLLISTAPWLLKSKNSWVLVDREAAETTLAPPTGYSADAAHEQLADIPAFTPWRKRCGAVAALYDLSPREVEVFFLVAKGRNAEYIQRTLFISTHTAKTHIANIYRKLEIHSLQELLDMIEATQAPAE
jgi:DNA-binding CsgD family transcriptional regulator